MTVMPHIDVYFLGK